MVVEGDALLGFANLNNALAGRVAGLQIISQPAAKLGNAGVGNIRLRGETGFATGGDPIYVLDGVPVQNINELEYIDGFVFANVYQTDKMVKIDPSSGFVVGKIDFGDVLRNRFTVTNRTDYFNGIAYDSATKKFLVTGKRWPKMFELKF